MKSPFVSPTPSLSSSSSHSSPPPIESVSLGAAWVPIVVLIVLLVLNVWIYKDNASLGPNQIALLISAAVAAVVGTLMKVPFSAMLRGIHQSISSALTAILILLLIGSLIGTWVISGIVPALIYYGLQILNPQVFLAAAVVICSIVSVATGSSWSTVGTVGVALLGIGNAMGISPAMTGGAIISGAYFGDKISPLSDTTNLAAVMAGTDLLTHIKYMLWTTVPSITITLAIFVAIGFSSESSASTVQTNALMSAIEAKFNLTPVLFVVPLIVLGLVIAKVDAVVALFVGAILGGLAAILFQPAVITQVANLPLVVDLPSGLSGLSDAAEPLAGSVGGERADEIAAANGGTTGGTNGGAMGGSPKIHPRQPHYLKRSYAALINAMAGETSVVPAEEVDRLKGELLGRRLAAARIQTGNANLSADQFSASSIELTQTFPELEGQIAAAGLMKGKGMASMLTTIWLIVCAMCFGGVMEACGLLQRIAASLLTLAKSTGSLIATTAGSCIFVNVTASDQYLAIVVPGRMFREPFARRGLAPENLSRTLEDAGTVTSVLVPWNTCGAFQAAALGVATWSYAPFCFFNWISPLMTILFGALGIKTAKLEQSSGVTNDK